MPTKILWMAGTGLVACLVALAAYVGSRPVAALRIDADDAALVARGKVTYTSHCAACHGAQLEGQPDWRKAGPDGRLPAPPHDESGHTWHHPDDYLIHVVAEGLVPGVDRPLDYQGNMPAFGKVLPASDIVAVLSYIKSSWSFDYRVWQEQSGTAGAPRPAAQPSPAHLKAKGDAFFAESLKALDRSVLPLRGYAGQPLIVYFWASWCAECRAETEALMALQRQHAAAGLKVIGIGVDQADRIERFSRDGRLDFPVLVGGSEGIALSRRMGNLREGMPFVAALDRQGRVSATHLGAFAPDTPTRMAAAAMK